MKNKIIFLFFILYASSFAKTVVEKTAEGVILRTAQGTMKLRVIRDDIVQVIKSPVDQLPYRKSLSEVDHLICDVKFSIVEKDQVVILKTRKIQVHIRKKDQKVSFINLNGKLILQEIDGKMVPASIPGDTAWTVSQSFVSPEKEAVYGLGSYQYNVVNWKNGFMRMQQKNTAIAMPVIVSNQGYGLFWHNYSLTTFNPDVDTLALIGIGENIVGLEYVPKTTGSYTLIIKKEDWFPIEMTVNDSLVYAHYGGVSYPWIVVKVNLHAGQPTAIRLKKLDKPIYPTVSSQSLIPTGGKPWETGLKGEYFTNTNFEGSPTFVRVDSVIDFNWGDGGPASGFPIDKFSIRWSGKLIAPVTMKNVSLDVTTDDGVRVYLDGKKVIDDWRERAPETNSYVMDIENGKSYDIVIEYYENAGGASARLSWDAEGPGKSNRLLDKVSLFCRTPEKSGVMEFQSEVADAIDYYFIFGPEPDAIVSGMRTITGKAPLYPKWTYGLHMCQYGWVTQEKIESVIDGYRNRKIPVDVIVQDADYWRTYPDNQWGSHRFDTSRYQNPAAMIRHVHDQNAHLVISVWPRINKGTDVYDSMSARGYLLALQNTSGRMGEGIVIADDSPNAAYDPFSAYARKAYWGFMNNRLFQLGIDGWWMDASEPEWGYDFSMAHTALGTGRRYLNAYPLMSMKSVYEGQRSTESLKRPYLLTRSAFPGQQRYAAAVWTGDVSGDWSTYRRQIPAGLNYCITGAPYWTIDIGGFKDYIDASKYDELLVRWFQYGTFLPIQRVHGVRKTEFYNHKPETVDLLVKYTHLRYRLLPYIYSMAADVSLHDFTILRPLIMDFRYDSSVNNILDQFMFGREMLVCPVVEQGADSRSVYLPKTEGEWIDFWTAKHHVSGQSVRTSAPLETIPLFVKAGSIIPMGPYLQYVTEKPADPIELRVYTGADGSFTLYEDESDNFNYEKGMYSTIPIQWNESKQTLTIGKRTGTFPGMLERRVFHVVWVRDGHGSGLDPEEKPDQIISYDGKRISISRH